MAALEGSTLAGDANGRKDELATAEKEDTSGASQSPEPLPKKTLLSLPDELLSAIAGLTERVEDLKNLQLTARRFGLLCKSWIWREVTFDEEYTHHDILMAHLVTTSLASLVRSLHYVLPSPFSTMSVVLLTTNFTNLTDLTIYPNDQSQSDDEEDHGRVPRALTSALKALPALRSLRLGAFDQLEDTTFSIAAELPNLIFLNAKDITLPHSLFHSGPTLRSLEVCLNDVACAAIGACAGTLHSLILLRNYVDGEKSASQAKCLDQLRRLFEPMSPKHRTLPLQSLWLQHFELEPTDDSITRSHPELWAFLSAFEGTSLSTLRFTGFEIVKCSANADLQLELSLPSVQALEFAASSSASKTQLDNDSMLLLRSLLRCFPNANHLALGGWINACEPHKLVSLQSLELGIYSPAFYLLLDPLRQTSLVEIKLTGGWTWRKKIVRLLRGEDGFSRELLWTC